MAETKKKRLKTFPDIEAKDFQHPWDIKATDALKSVPGLDQVVSKILEYGLERIFYLQNTAANVRVTARQFPRLYRSLGWGCKILGVEEPELYIELNPVPNAYTYGHTRPFIVLTSGLVDMLDDEERFFVISHELGHIKAGHVLYTVIARNIAEIVAIVGQATFGVGALLGQGLVLALHDWYRKSELTSDRAGLLCVQDIDPCIRTFMKLAGGASKLYGEMDKQEFLRQIREYEAADVSTLNKAYKVLITAYRTHPFPILRAKELDAWHSSGYRTLAGPLGLLEA
ncbi:MAG TPA: M48 family metallopeptidase [Blastocatellia bacterium]|nr:M48 family metallopeptidase [Blastocatellia bacterium]HMV82935.1 M48 family metallopeptidase [Blastocatellia bacterium]HMX27255.1 M48 family metallopeptidase [Blastocatellia bacterium]HMY72962.1 M48 family metallopeptidase [Blastocatellia bacterium]HMZ22435.1 M48 family metallopeptidase [Blastocatellia bacterium]